MNTTTMSRASFPREVDAEARCPSCLRRGLESFYRIDGIPVHSTLLMSSRQEALDYPVGDLELALCRACGFVTNKVFNPRVHEYSQRCEESQAFSGTFNAFAESLAKRIIERYDLHDKTVLEIGCGKADFLMLLCSLADNRGVGIDPSTIVERLPPEMREKIQVINELYSLRHGDIEADFICSRHTLEHIAPVGTFVDQIRATVKDTDGTPVFIEVPDALRVLREGAFWDIYYEHCSYFSCGSLARLFRSRCFDVDMLELEYDDQYVLLGARPDRTTTAPRFDLEDDLEMLLDGVRGFEERTRAAIRHWRELITRAAARGERVVVWGSSSKGVAFLTTLGVTQEVEYVVDINTYRQGKFMPGSGHEIVGPEFLREYRPDHVIAMNPIYQDEIGRDLERLGVRARLHCV